MLDNGGADGQERLVDGCLGIGRRHVASCMRGDLCEKVMNVFIGETCRVEVVGRGTEADRLCKEGLGDTNESEAGCLIKV
jgi:hypothetical protein